MIVPILWNNKEELLDLTHSLLKKAQVLVKKTRRSSKIITLLKLIRQVIPTQQVNSPQVVPFTLSKTPKTVYKIRQKKKFR